MLVTISLASTTHAAPIAYQTPMEKSQWQFHGSPHGCEIRHHVDGFGDYVLSAKPGENTAISLEAEWLSLDKQTSDINIINTSWQTGQQPRSRGNTMLYWHGQQATSQTDAAQFVEALEQSKTWSTRVNLNGDIGYIINSAPVNTRSTALAFRQCRQKLLPKPYGYVRHVTFNFASGESLLSTQQIDDIQAIAAYIKVDPSIKQVLVDGHTDGVGDRLANLVLSKQRADEVSARLIDVGINTAMIQVRHHGTRSPLVSNHSPEGQAKNRRVSVRLIKDVSTTKLAQEQAGVPQ
ncbi:OmpA family protein [Shewanella waksmanii]|uniref:MotY family protein n=1 Tax=Shewanella waksmanii TaxID=213783 RepID=UPI0037361177